MSNDWDEKLAEETKKHKAIHDDGPEALSAGVDFKMGANWAKSELEPLLEQMAEALEFVDKSIHDAFVINTLTIDLDKAQRKAENALTAYREFKGEKK